MSRQDDIKKQIFNHNRRLQKLKEQQALQGQSVDPKILIEIEDIEAELEELQQEELAEIENRAASPRQINVISGSVHEKSQSVPSIPAMSRQEPLAPWVHLLRRVIFLLIAFGLALTLIDAIPTLLPGPPIDIPGPAAGADTPISLRSGRPVVELVGERMPNTLLLLGAGLFLALLLAFVMALVGMVAHKLEEKMGLPGSVLKWFGRVITFGGSVAPVFIIATFLIFIFALQFNWLPTGGMASLAGPVGLVDRFNHLILPALALALFPAIVTAQTVAWEVNRLHEQNNPSFRLAGLLRGLGALAGQIGGLFSAAIMVEVMFSWPGVGRLLVESVISRDYPVLLGVLSSSTGLILGGRLAAELFYWLERLLAGNQSGLQFSPSAWTKRARLIWLIVALTILLVPVGLAAGGLTTEPERALEMDIQARHTPPSADHPWGTDELGRDIQARLLRGGWGALTITVLITILVLLPAGLIGLFTGLLALRRSLWAQLVADLILLPVDVLLFIPLIPGSIVIVSLVGQAGAGSVTLIATILLTPRLIRIGQSLWVAIFEPGVRASWDLAAVGGALFFAGAFVTFSLITALDFLGLGTPPPTPSLGGIFLGLFTSLAVVSPGSLLTTGLIIWAVAFVLYLVTDAFVSFFKTREALVRLNE